MQHAKRRVIVTADDIRRFQRDGYLVMRGIIDPLVCAVLRAAIWTRMPERFAQDDPANWRGRIQDCCTYLPLYQRKGLVRFKDDKGFARDPQFAAHIYADPLIGALFSGITGVPFERAWIRGLHPNLPMPRRVSLNEALGNRIDPQLEAAERPLVKFPCPPQMPIAGHLDVHSFELGAMLYLNDVGADGGALAVWPGSHRLFERAFETPFDFLPTGFYKRALNLLQCYRPVPIAAAEGDIILFHNRLMHANSINRSPAIRYAILLDLFGREWRERGAAQAADPIRRAQCRQLDRSKAIDGEAIVQAVVARQMPDPVRAFWMRRPRLRAAVHRLYQDPLASSRRGVSAKIRARKAGDCWIIVSQGAEIKARWKLDAHGSAKLGAYRLHVNGRPAARSDGGVLVERLALRGGANLIEIDGRFDTDHNVRIIRSRNPLPASDILFAGTVRTGERVLRATVEIDATAPAGGQTSTASVNSAPG